MNPRDNVDVDDYKHDDGLVSKLSQQGNIEKNKQPIRYEKNFKFKISNEILITINDDYD